MVIIAESIELTCPNVNANNSSNVSSFVGTTSEPLDIPYDEWKYMKDENKNNFPDFIEDFNNWYLLKDTDSDMLPDYIEESISSNPMLTDSDGDNLDDYYEVMVSFTNPVDTDSDDNLISDDNEDFDNDGLTNFQEYLLSTSPWDNDSDKDTLDDGTEINTYSTNPLEPDTDFDGLDDADEVALGVLPNVPDTDEDGILDGDEYYSGYVSQDLTSDDPKVSAVTGVEVELDCKGNADNCVNIENAYNVDMLSSDVVGIVGAPVNITSSAEFNTATITFTYDDTLLNDTTEEDLIILWYDRENKGYVMLEDTIVDTVNNTVSCTTTHFSTYLVIDREIWLDSWREKIEYSRQPSVIETAYNIGFVVDVSGSMNSERLSNAKTALNTFIDAMYECDDATLVSFNSSGNVVKNFGASKSELKSAVSALTASGGTSTNNGLSTAINEMAPHLSTTEKNIIILICDGDVENDSNTADLLQIAKNAEKPINIYTLNVCEADSDVLESIATQTGGVPYKAATAAQIASVMATLQQSTVSSIDMTDSDGDGLYDVYETQGIKYQNGQVYRTDPNKADTDGDGISDFDEVGGAPIAKVVNFFQSEYSCVLCNVNTNPTSVDTDGDTYTDDVDPEPYDYTMIKDFGSDGYIADIEYQAGELNPMALELTAWPYIGDYIFYKLKGEKDVANSAIELMMDDVNNCPYTYLVSDENWLNFCLEFNKYVQTYGEVDRTLHYFRLKLNRAPATLDDMIKTINCATEVNDKWIMCSPQKGRFHMFGEYGSFNIKFISSNNTDNIYEAVYDKNGKLLTESDDYGKNMGTFNYASSSKKGKLHNRLDVSTYEDMKNTYEDYVHRNDNDNPDDNVINKRPRNKQNNSEIDYDAQNHIIQICNKIGIDYELLIDNNFSDKCYSY